MEKIFLAFPIIVQTLVMTFDEFFFHVKRGLPRWERIGHPIDTLSVILCLSFCLFFPYSLKALLIFIALALLSCLLVTKDEFIHKEHCPAKEQWLHALLFINHPLVLADIGYMWSKKEAFSSFLWGGLFALSLFCLYQIVFWNFIWNVKKVKKYDQQ